MSKANEENCFLRSLARSFVRSFAGLPRMQNYLLLGRESTTFISREPKEATLKRIFQTTIARKQNTFLGWATLVRCELQFGLMAETPRF